jgi:hypothetical protein
MQEVTNANEKLQHSCRCPYTPLLQHMWRFCRANQGCDRYGDLDDELMLWEVESCTGGIGASVIPSGPACNYNINLRYIYRQHWLRGLYVVRLECSYIINLIEKYEMMCDKSLALICALEVFRFLDQKPPL